MPTELESALERTGERKMGVSSPSLLLLPLLPFFRLVSSCRAIRAKIAALTCAQKWCGRGDASVEERDMRNKK